jgi:hypothetical protein
MEAAVSSRMLVPIHMTAWHHISEDHNLNEEILLTASERCQKPTSKKYIVNTW